MTRKNVDIEREIVKFLSELGECKYIDIASNKILLNLRSKRTIESNISILREQNILQKTTEGLYRVNPFITDLSKDYMQQIEDGIKKEKRVQKLLVISFFKETELRNRIIQPEITPIYQNFGDLTKSLYFSDEINILIADLFYSFLREVIMLNPDLWVKMVKPEHFNFTYMIKCNWEKDPRIFQLIQELKKIYKSIGYIPFNNNSPYRKGQKTKLDKKIDEEYYKDALYEETLRKKVDDEVRKISLDGLSSFTGNYEKARSLLENQEHVFKELANIVGSHLESFDASLLFKEFNNMMDILKGRDITKNPTLAELRNYLLQYRKSFGFMMEQASLLLDFLKSLSQNQEE